MKVSKQSPLDFYQQLITVTYYTLQKHNCSWLDYNIFK
jgi:hypothetical protein